MRLGKRKGLSPIIAELLLVAITVGAGTTIFYFGSSTVGNKASGFSVLFGNAADAAKEAYVVEQTQFNTSSTQEVAITLTNHQGTPTPAPFQQQVVIDPSSYGGYVASDIGNVRFCADAGCAGYLDAWLESCSATPCSSASSAVVWVKLDAPIAANGGTATIYMTFLPLTAEFDGVYWGEAPALSGTYGQFDNGGSVFAAYFRGDSTSGWTVAGTAGATAAAPAGSATGFGTDAFYANSANGDYMDTDAGYSATGNYVIQYYSYTTGLGNLFFSASSAGAGTMTRLDSRGGADYSGLAKTASWTAWDCPASSTTSSADTWYQWSVVIAGGGTQVGDYYTAATSGLGTLGTQVNALGTTYTDGCGGGAETYSAQGSYVGLVGDGLGAGYVTYWNGIIVRAYPPGGVMPAVATGTLGVVTSETAVVTVRNVGSVEVEMASMYLYNQSAVGAGYPASASYSLTSSPPITIATDSATPYCSVSGGDIVIPVSSFCEVSVPFDFHPGVPYEVVVDTQRGNSVSTVVIA